MSTRGVSSVIPRRDEMVRFLRTQKHAEAVKCLSEFDPIHQNTRMIVNIKRIDHVVLPMLIDLHNESIVWTEGRLDVRLPAQTPSTM